MQYEYGAVKNFKTQPSKDNEEVIPDDDIYEDEVPSDFPKTLPYIEEPGTGYITIAIYVPEETCNGAILVGAGIDGGSDADWTPQEKNNPFTELYHEDRWYTITLPYSDYLSVKAIAINESGVADWWYQWGKNIPEENIENVVFLQGEGMLEEENGGEQLLTQVPDGSVVYIGIKEWKSAPCVPRNKAGLATFTLTAATPLPEGSVVGIVGSINEYQYWDIFNPIIMTQNGNTYTATYTVGDDCQYKYAYSLDGGYNWDWNYMEKGNNREMPLDLNAVDTVEYWTNLPYEEYN